MYSNLYYKINNPIVEIFLVETPHVHSIKMIAGDFFQTLNFGIPALKEGSIRWRGNEFGALNSSGVSMTGLLRVDESFLPRQLFCKVAGASTDYLLDYKYDSGSGGVSTYPTRITTSVVVSGKTNRLVETRIISLKTSSSLLSTNQINPEFILAGSKTVILNSNEVQFMKRPNGKLINLNTAPRRSAGGNMAKMMVYCLFAVLLFALPVLLFRDRTDQAKKQP